MRLNELEHQLLVVEDEAIVKGTAHNNASEVMAS
jgi:hypothetical protein